MRSSKSRSRSKPNRQRTLGNIVNRVFDSSGPEGKVRGTPQQIIEKYLTLARDAQLSNDRVAEQSFFQHAEHYTRLLGEAMREQAERQQQNNQSRGDGRDDERGDSDDGRDSQNDRRDANNGDRNNGDRNGGDRSGGDRGNGDRNGGQRQSSDRGNGDRNSSDRSNTDRGNGDRTDSDRTHNDRHSGQRSKGERQPRVDEHARTDSDADDPSAGQHRSEDKPDSLGASDGHAQIAGHTETSEQQPDGPKAEAARSPRRRAAKVPAPESGTPAPGLPDAIGDSDAPVTTPEQAQAAPPRPRRTSQPRSRARKPDSETQKDAQDAPSVSENPTE